METSWPTLIPSAYQAELRNISKIVHIQTQDIT